MSDYSIILIMIGVGATIILTGLYIWQVFFWRSWGRVINLIMGIFIANDNLIDPNKKIEPDLSLNRSDIMKAHAEALEAEAYQPPTGLQRAHIPKEEDSQYDRTTSESGWPRTLSAEERRASRPFRHVHIATENEALSKQARQDDDDNDDDDDDND